MLCSSLQYSASAQQQRSRKLSQKGRCLLNEALGAVCTGYKRKSWSWNGASCSGLTEIARVARACSSHRPSPSHRFLPDDSPPMIHCSASPDCAVCGAGSRAACARRRAVGLPGWASRAEVEHLKHTMREAKMREADSQRANVLFVCLFVGVIGPPPVTTLGYGRRGWAQAGSAREPYPGEGSTRN